MLQTMTIRDVIILAVRLFTAEMDGETDTDRRTTVTPVGAHTACSKIV